MRKFLKPNCAALTTLLIYLVTSPVSAQKGHPPAWVYNIKKINIQGLDSPYGLQDWIVTGEKSSVGFLADFNQNTETTSFISFRVNQRGKSRGSAVPILSGIPNMRGYLDALWIEPNESSPHPGGENGYGLVFVAYLEDEGLKNAVLAVAKFDADGQRTTAFNTLMRVTAPEGEIIVVTQSIATGREGAVGLVFSLIFMDETNPYYTFTGSKSWFAEVDLDGKPLSSTPAVEAFKEISLPNKGRKQYAICGTPAWNGSRWLIPFCITYLNNVPHGSYYYQVILREDLAVAIGMKGSEKLSVKRILGRNDETRINSYRFFFLPREITTAQPTGKLGDDLDLFYQHFSAIPYEEIKLDSANYDYGIQRINGKGKKVGPGVVVELPKWNHQLIYNPTFPLIDNVERVSSPILDSEGKVLIACTRSLKRRIATSTLEYEQEFSLYNVDRLNGNVTLRAISHPGVDAFFSENPILGWLNGKLTVINGGWVTSAGTYLGEVLTPFFTSF
jgi:hypothetical protein